MQRRAFVITRHRPIDERSMTLRETLRELAVPLDALVRTLLMQGEIQQPLGDPNEDTPVMVASGYPTVLGKRERDEMDSCPFCDSQSVVGGKSWTSPVSRTLLYFCTRCDRGASYWDPIPLQPEVLMVARYTRVWQDDAYQAYWQEETPTVVIATKSGRAAGELTYVDGEWFFVNSIGRDVSNPGVLTMHDATALDLQDRLFHHGLDVIEEAVMPYIQNTWMDEVVTTEFGEEVDDVEPHHEDEVEE